uniref:Transcriptional regulator n=2 Tax=Aquisalinus luteolus TaxID=1566827 RepID=A0A8J3A481_9PROT|nr:transcriptional regulator [Aquisalinus luteolus]
MTNAMTLPDAQNLPDLSEMSDKAGQAARHLKLLANEKRLMILCTLIAAGDMSVGALAERVGLSQSALSQHLSRLREDGLLATSRKGQTIHYRIDDPGTAEIIAVLYRLYCA